MQSGITVLELLVIVTLFGVLTLVVSNRSVKIERNEQVAAAVYDANLLRRGLEIYKDTYRHYPTDQRGVVLDLVMDVRNEQGFLMMKPVFGKAFSGFHYVPDPEGLSYQIEVKAQDNKHTRIITTPKGTRLEYGNPASKTIRHLKY
jgi:type II secretory pathway pseudopilin PulG